MDHRSRDRDYDREYERSSKRSRDLDRRQRSRSKERFERKRRSRSRDREREPERDRDRGDRRRNSRSRSPNRSNQGQGRDHHHQAHSSQSSQIRIKREKPDPDEQPRSSSHHRERDWNNFFNPNSEMSKKAVIKREREEEDRKEQLSEFGPSKDSNEDSEKPKEQPNFGLSGKLTEETNTYRGVVIKYSEPAEARKPNKIRWRLYPFKGEEALPVMYVHRQSAYLLGRERKIADIPVDHPSCSKQHAVLQYRLVPYVRSDGSKGRRIRPYIIDLESANGTYVNGKRIDPKRYVELFEKDVLKFGYSSREYVLLHDESKNIEDDYAEMTPD